jgi:hypothetical protein
MLSLCIHYNYLHTYQYFSGNQNISFIDGNSLKNGFAIGAAFSR